MNSFHRKITSINQSNITLNIMNPNHHIIISLIITLILTNVSGYQNIQVDRSFINIDKIGLNINSHNSNKQNMKTSIFNLYSSNSTIYYPTDSIYYPTDSNYLSVSTEHDLFNLTLSIHTIKISNNNITHNTIAKNIIPIYAIQSISPVKVTKLSEDIILISWSRRSYFWLLEDCLMGQFIQSSINTSYFVDDPIIIDCNTSRIQGYDIEMSGDSSFSVSIHNVTNDIGGDNNAIKTYRYNITSGNVSLTEIGPGISIYPTLTYSLIGQVIGNRFMTIINSRSSTDQIKAAIYTIESNRTVSVAQSLKLSPIGLSTILIDIIRVDDIWVYLWKYSVVDPLDFRLMSTGVDVNGSIVVDSYEIYKISPQTSGISQIGKNMFAVISQISSQSIYFKVIERRENKFIEIWNDTRIDEPRDTIKQVSMISILQYNVGDVFDNVNTFGITWSENQKSSIKYKTYIQFYNITDIIIDSVSETKLSTNVINSDSLRPYIVILIIIIITIISLCILSAGIFILKMNRNYMYNSKEDRMYNDSKEGNMYNDSKGDHKSVRIEKTRTKILERYSLIDKIAVDEAADLNQQTGILVKFPSNVNRVNFLVGEGAGGKVRLALDEETNRFVGVKKLKGNAIIQKFEHEHQIQLELDHPNVLTLLDVVHTSDSQGHPVAYLFMELLMMDGILFSGIIQELNVYVDPLSISLTLQQEGDVSSEELSNIGFRNSISMEKERIILYVFRNIIAGIAYMHRVGYYHRDLKLSNFLIGKNGEVKIIDFGHTCILEDGMSDRASGDMLTFSPECNELLRLGPGRKFVDINKCDIWAIGLALLEIIIGRHPLDNMTRDEMIGRTDEYYRRMINPIIDSLNSSNSSNSIILIVKAALSIDPITRATSEYLETMFTQIPEQFVDISTTNYLNILRSGYLNVMGSKDETGQIYVSNVNDEVLSDYIAPNDYQSV